MSDIKTPEEINSEQKMEAAIWLSKQKYQTEQGQQEYKMYFDVDIPKMLARYAKHKTENIQSERDNLRIAMDRLTELLSQQAEKTAKVESELDKALKTLRGVEKQLADAGSERDKLKEAMTAIESYDRSSNNLSDTDCLMLVFDIAKESLKSYNEKGGNDNG